jgi:hypothetical protein
MTGGNGNVVMMTSSHNWRSVAHLLTSQNQYHSCLRCGGENREVCQMPNAGKGSPSRGFFANMIMPDMHSTNFRLALSEV